MIQVHLDIIMVRKKVINDENVEPIGKKRKRRRILRRRKITLKTKTTEYK